MKNVPIGRPMEMVAMDFVGPLPLTERGNRHLLVIADYYTKWIEAIPTRDQKANTTAQALLEQVSRHGIPVVMHSDKGPNFEAKVMKELCNSLGMTKSRTTAYHPQCDGLVERANRTLLGMLAKYGEENQRDWDLKVPIALFGYRTAVQSSTGVSPFELLYGREPRTPADNAFGNPGRAPLEPSEHLSELTERLAALRDITEGTLAAAQAKQKKYYDERSSETLEYKEGEIVYLHVPRVKKGCVSKLTRFWKGPYEVEHVYDEATVKIRPVKGGRAQRVHINRLKPCYRTPIAQGDEQQSEIERREALDPLREIVDAEPDFDLVLEFRNSPRRAGNTDEQHAEGEKDELAEAEGVEEETEDEDGATEVPQGERPRRVIRLPLRLRDYVVDLDDEDEDK